MLISPGLIERIVTRRARSASASAAALLCQSATHCPVRIRTTTTSLEAPMVTEPSAGTSVRSSSFAVRPCRVQIAVQRCR
jgi:hypothetical protein